MSDKGKIIMQWVLVILISFQFLFIGFSKLNGDMLASFQSWGYSEAFMYFIGCVEIFTGVGLFFERTRIMSSLGQVAVMLGAAYTHWMHGQYFEILINVGLIGLCTIILWLEQEKKVASMNHETSGPY